MPRSQHALIPGCLALCCSLAVGCADPEPTGPLQAEPKPVAPDRPDLELRTYKTAIVNGLSRELVFELSDGVQSVLIEVRGERGRFHLQDFVTPFGPVTDGGTFRTSFAQDMPGLVNWLYPNSPRLQRPERGTYKLVIRGEAEGGKPLAAEDVEVRVYTKKQTEFETCTLRLDFLVDNVAIDPSVRDQAIDDYVVPWIDDAFYQVGVGLKDYAVSAVTLPVTSFSSDSEQLRDDVDAILELGRSKHIVRDESLHLVVAREIGSRSDPLGYTAGIPGPYDPDRSDAAILIGAAHHVEGDTLDPLALGSAITHEIGHFMGLYHPSEVDGGNHDPLPDTPECTDPPDSGCTQAKDQPTFRSNIMAVGTGKDRTWISEGQGFVIRNHPLCAPGEIRQRLPTVPMCDGTCATGETCSSIGGVAACRPTCFDATDCTVGEACEPDDFGRRVCR
jgi:hypothetical protein